MRQAKKHCTQVKLEPVIFENSHAIDPLSSECRIITKPVTAPLRSSFIPSCITAVAVFHNKPDTQSRIQFNLKGLARYGDAGRMGDA